MKKLVLVFILVFGCAWLFPFSGSLIALSIGVLGGLLIGASSK
jgi:hypothetical protein